MVSASVSGGLSSSTSSTAASSPAGSEKERRCWFGADWDRTSGDGAGSCEDQLRRKAPTSSYPGDVDTGTGAARSPCDAEMPVER
jgi:hypothetical protein